MNLSLLSSLQGAKKNIWFDSCPNGLFGSVSKCPVIVLAESYKSKLVQRGTEASIPGFVLQLFVHNIAVNLKALSNEIFNTPSSPRCYLFISTPRFISSKRP
jgi:hypothetical protein